MKDLCLERYENAYDDVIVFNLLYKGQKIARRKINYFNDKDYRDFKIANSFYSDYEFHLNKYETESNKDFLDSSEVLWSLSIEHLFGKKIQPYLPQ